MGKIIGIELGLHNCRMAILDKNQPKTIETIDGKKLIPSVVGIDEYGDRFVGELAKQQAILDPANTISGIRHFMGRNFRDPDVQRDVQMVSYKITESSNGEVEVWLRGKAYSLPEISAMILKALKQEADEQIGEVTHAVITVPAYFGQRQKDATREAGRLAGLEVLQLISEPVAAALAYGIHTQSSQPKTVLVYDLGSSSFDVTILLASGGTFTNVAVKGDNHLGGDDFDQAIVNHIISDTQRRYGLNLSDNREALQKLKHAAEQAKIQLTKRQKVPITIPHIAKDSKGNSIDMRLELAREEYEIMIRSAVQRTIDLTLEAIHEADYRLEDIDYVLLVGGSTLTPLVVESLGKEVSKDKILNSVDPMECIALGAAVQTGIPIKGQEKKKLTRSTQRKAQPKDHKGSGKTHSSTPPFVLRMMATCFVNADHLSEAERLLQNPAWGQDGDTLRYELGMAYAAQGKLAEALNQFNTFLQRQPDHAKARQAFLDILRLQANQQITQQKWEDAADTLWRALEISPNDEQLLHTLSGVQETLPVQVFVQQKRDQAIRVWERVQAANPTNYQVAHRLAILHHRWAIELEQQGQIQAADLRWRKAIANWAMLAATDAFWPAWKAKREEVYGVAIEQENIEKLRRTGLRDRLEQVHRDFQTAYSEANDQKNSERHAEYRLLLKLELKTAEALKETANLLRKHNRPIKVPVCAGPLLLTQLGLLTDAKQVATAAQQLDNRVDVPKILATYLSPIGRVALLVEERQTERAIPELRQIVKKEPTNTEARRLLVLALKEAGNGVITNNAEQALNFWAEAVEYDPNNMELKELIAQTCIEQATKQRGSELNKAITTLERGVRYAPDHRSLKENLAACLNQRGVGYANDKQDWDRSIVDLQRAVQLDPSNQMARDNLQKVQEAREMAPVIAAVEHLNAQRYSAATFQHIGILSLEFHVDKLSRPLL